MSSCGLRLEVLLAAKRTVKEGKNLWEKTSSTLKDVHMETDGEDDTGRKTKRDDTGRKTKRKTKRKP